MEHGAAQKSYQRQLTLYTLTLVFIFSTLFFLQYKYNLKQAGGENREEYQSWDY